MYHLHMNTTTYIAPMLMHALTKVVPRDKVCRDGKSTHWQSGCFLGHDNMFLQASYTWGVRRHLHTN